METAVEFTLTDYVAPVCAASSILLYMTGWPAVWTVMKRKSTGDMSTFPYIAMLVNCSSWVGYGSLVRNNVLLVVNTTGSVLQSIFITFFYCYSKSKRLINQQILFAFLFLLAIYYYIYQSEDTSGTIKTLGPICSCLAVLAYAAPLSAMGEVISTKSTSSMNFPLSVANLIVGVEWSAYGFLLGDYYVMGPNILGVIVSFLQVSLFYIYPNKPATVLPA
ncbi:sugar transporter SWEET1-like [Watersipora subatra]|uniref:sugar transporter SWEET1-like n=1 Tax=Watersipora subatra TaxID=2589382 RepID=UPI00355BA1E2